MNESIFSKLLQDKRQLGPLDKTGLEKTNGWSHWRLAYDEQGVVWIVFDSAGSNVNTITESVLKELDQILDQIDHNQAKGLVLRSAKKTNFCVGADINEFQKLTNETKVVDKLKNAHAVVDRIAALSIPTIAIIHGTCLGGGLELSLGCNYRLAISNARMGLPEILLGLHPGLGGTARLTHLIDPLKAMTMMLTGRVLDAKHAKDAGLVDKVIEERHVLRAVQAIMNGHFKSHSVGLKDRLLATAPARHLEARQMRAKTGEKINMEHYPAAEALITLWEKHGDNAETMREAEIRSFAKLLTSTTAQNLIHLFFVREKMKRVAKTGDSTIKHVHVIGAGSMGGDIAGWCAFKGLRVTLFDTDFKMVAKAIKKTVDLCRKKNLHDNITRDVFDRLIPDEQNSGIAHADLIIEAVPEKIGIKQAVYEQLEPKIKASAIIATNTSSIPLEELAKALKNPARLIGLHFFNPVAKMQLVEVVVQNNTDEATLEKAKTFVGQIERLPAEVKSSAGFLVNRVLSAYLLEAIQVVDEGVSLEQVDLAAECFGMPIGPIELADRVGLDICLHVVDMLKERLSMQMAPVPQSLHDLVKNKHLGLKAGRGFYVWKDGKPQKKQQNADLDPELVDRLILPMLNTCVACLREKVVTDPELLDGAIVFGTGFAPFRGGPLHYARERGIEDIVNKLNKFANTCGQRFSPDEGWKNKSFFEV